MITNPLFWIALRSGLFLIEEIPFASVASFMISSPTSMLTVFSANSSQNAISSLPLDSLI
ncbi:TPA: hypothetical protein DEP21_04845 [Patescibacteria group bacterium]|nr:hypothetical protein [Candidatus Gracilibacteria bacterium]